MGFGTGTEADRFQADGEAVEAATEQVNSLCVGEVIDIARTGGGCTDFGTPDAPSFTCTAVMKGECRLPGR
jgi:hypothetical protein